MDKLYCKLLQNGQSDYYPYHMPGHKRRPLTEILGRVADIDITEIDGFDNLHHAEGILKEIQEHAAKVYGAEESFYLVGGSTAGILSSISAVLPRGGHLLMARNCHKAAYHGAYLNGLKVTYLFPPMHEIMDFAMGITADQVAEALECQPDIGGVLIVSPTYEGLTADIQQIADLVHSKGIPLIVDEAHGAHLGFHPAWPESACRQGADIVIQSLHKTLPSMTQTAVLHVNGRLVDRERIKRFLAIYQTSSPSYVFMAGMEEAISYMEEQGFQAMEQFRIRWEKMQSRLTDCRNLRIYPQHSGQDIGKLVISVKGTTLTGQQLYELLLKKYHLQLEMAGGTYVLAMFTLADTEEGYERLTAALLEIDRQLELERQAEIERKPEVPDSVSNGLFGGAAVPCKELELYEAWDREKELLELQKSEGRLAGEFINLYPPGIPVIVPGERIGKETLEVIEGYIRQNLPVHGVEHREGKLYIKVLKHEMKGNN